VLKDKGILFLKCFSDKEPRQEGPYKFSQQEIRDLFSKYFRIDSIKETVYQGTLDPLPKALFAVMIKIENLHLNNWAEGIDFKYMRNRCCMMVYFRNNLILFYSA
jgi:hypothetical protein